MSVPTLISASGLKALALGAANRKKSSPPRRRLKSFSEVPIVLPSVNAVAVLVPGSTTRMPVLLTTTPPTGWTLITVEPLAAPMITSLSAAVEDTSMLRFDPPDPTNALLIVSTSPVAPSLSRIAPLLAKLVCPVIDDAPSSAMIVPLLVNATAGTVKAPGARSSVPLLLIVVKPEIVKAPAVSSGPAAALLNAPGPARDEPAAALKRNELVVTPNPLRAAAAPRMHVPELV